MLLKNEFTFLGKSKIKAGEGKKEGLYPFFTSSDSKILFLNNYLFDTEAVILGTGGMPSCNYFNGKFSVSTDNYVLVPKGKIKPKTLYYYLRKDNLCILEKGFHGAGLKHIGKDYIEMIDLPNIPEKVQLKLINELDLIVNTLSIISRQILTQDELIKAHFYEMFGDPILNTKKLPTKKVIDVVKLQRGFDLPVQNRKTNGKIPLYGSNGLIDYHDEAKCNFGVITGRSGTLGKVYYSEKPFWPLNTTLFSVDCHGNNVIYLSYLLSYFDLSRFGAGSGVPTLNRNTFHDEQIIDVPKPLQEQFALFVKSIYKVKDALLKEKSNYEELYESKLHEYFGN